MRSSGLSATQSQVAVHFPIPPLAANRVHLASSDASKPIPSPDFDSSGIQNQLKL